MPSEIKFSTNHLAVIIENSLLWNDFLPFYTIFHFQFPENLYWDMDKHRLSQTNLNQNLCLSMPCICIIPGMESSEIW
ncbi:MAG: hypothetical protein DRI57_21980 [Deltaproteobacteria bacterium]|nr:MAG: hypothetical protein DRI57_21980 [Deltaproteobacteria bacterium]